MGFFYKLPDDLRELEGLVSRVAVEIAMVGKGLETPGYLDEMMPEVVDAMRSTRERLLISGREADLRSFRKHVLSKWRAMDNGPYNSMFFPLVTEYLSA